MIPMSVKGFNSCSIKLFLADWLIDLRVTIYVNQKLVVLCKVIEIAIACSSVFKAIPLYSVLLIIIDEPLEAISVFIFVWFYDAQY